MWQRRGRDGCVRAREGKRWGGTVWRRDRIDMSVGEEREEMLIYGYGRC